MRCASSSAHPRAVLGSWVRTPGGRATHRSGAGLVSAGDFAPGVAPWCDLSVKPSARRHPTSALLGAALAGLLATTSCSLVGGGRSAEDEANDLAAALSEGRLGGLTYTGGTPAQAQALWRRAVAGLGDSEPRVSVGKGGEGGGGSGPARVGDRGEGGG